MCDMRQEDIFLTLVALDSVIDIFQTYFSWISWANDCNDRSFENAHYFRAINFWYWLKDVCLDDQIH